MLQLKDFRASQEKEPCIRLTQENLMKFLVQYIYLYILISDGLCLTISSLS